MASQWTKLGEKTNIHALDPFFINSNEILMIPYIYESPYHDVWIMKYNIEQNRWINWLKFPVHLINYKVTNHHIAVLNKNKTKIYIYNQDANVIQFDITTKSFKISKSTDDKFWNFLYEDYRPLWINEQLHIFGGHNTNKSHYILDTNTARLKEIHRFDKIELDFGSLSHHCVEYISSKKSVLIIPGEYNSKSVYLYNIMTNKCIKLPMGFEDELYEPETVITKDERFVIVFPGINNDDIYVIDLKLMSIKRCDIKCPGYHYWAVTIRNDEYKEDLTLSGFVREITNIPNMQYPPIYLLQVIQLYYCQEMIYLFGQHKRFTYWKISVDDLINSVSYF